VEIEELDVLARLRLLEGAVENLRAEKSRLVKTHAKAFAALLHRIGAGDEHGETTQAFMTTLRQLTVNSPEELERLDLTSLIHAALIELRTDAR